MLSSGMPGRVTTPGSFWLGRAQLGLALLRLAFPSILNCNEWQLHSRCSSVASVTVISARMKTLYEKLLEAGRALKKKEEEYACEMMYVYIMYIKVHVNPKHKLLKERPTNPVQLP